MKPHRRAAVPGCPRHLAAPRAAGTHERSERRHPLAASRSHEQTLPEAVNAADMDDHGKEQQDVAITGDALEAADQRAFARPVPKTVDARMRFPVRTERTTRAAVRLPGVSQPTVERYVKGRIERPRPEPADRLAREVRVRWQPRVCRRAVTVGGITVGTRTGVRVHRGRLLLCAGVSAAGTRSVSAAVPGTGHARLRSPLRSGRSFRHATILRSRPSAVRETSWIGMSVPPDRWAGQSRRHGRRRGAW